MEEAIIIDAPAAIEPLSAALELKAELYLDARRRVGQGTLDAARAVAEARSSARHGEWGPWLAKTGLSPDGAERLQAIHAQALADPLFAERVRTGFLGLTVAGEIARSSEPNALLQRLLAVELPPTVGNVRALKQLEAPANTAAMRDLDDPYIELRSAIQVESRWNVAVQLIAKLDADDPAAARRWAHDLNQMREIGKDLRERRTDRFETLIQNLNDDRLRENELIFVESACKQLGLDWPPKPAESAWGTPGFPERGIYLHTPPEIVPVDWDAWRARAQAVGGSLTLGVGGVVTGNDGQRRLGSYRISDQWGQMTAEIEALERRVAADGTVTPASIAASIRSCLARLDTHAAQPLLYGLPAGPDRGRWMHDTDRVQEVGWALHRQDHGAARVIVETLNDNELRTALLVHVGAEAARTHLVEQAREAGYTLTFTPGGAGRFVDTATGELAAVAADLSMVEAKLNGLTTERADPSEPRPNPAPPEVYADLSRRAQAAGTSIRWVGFAGSNAAESHFEVYEPSSGKMSRYPARTPEAGPAAWAAALGRVEAIIGQAQQQPAPEPAPPSTPADDEAGYVEVCDEDEGGEEISLIRVRLGRSPLVAEALAAIGEAVYRLDMGEAHAIDDGLLSELRSALAAGGLRPGMAMLLDTVIDAVLGAVDDALGNAAPPPPLPSGAEADDPPAVKLLLARLADGEKSTIPLARQNLARSCERDLTALADELDDDRYSAIAARIRALAPPKAQRVA